MKIDTHQHFWRYAAQDYPWISGHMGVLRTDRLPTDVAQACAAAGVEGAIAVQARAQARETDFLLELAQNHPQVLGVIGWADLGSPQLGAQLERWQSQSAFKGLRHLLQDEADACQWLQREGVAQGLRSLQSRALVYEVLVYHHQMDAALALCQGFDAHWLVLDHLGKPPLAQWEQVEARRAWLQKLRAVAALPHVVCKLSGLVTELGAQDAGGVTAREAMTECLDAALEAFGPQRLMFGSDWPVCLLAASYADVHGVVQEWAQKRLTRQEQEQLWGGTAQRVYALAGAAAASGMPRA